MQNKFSDQPEEMRKVEENFFLPATRKDQTLKKRYIYPILTSYSLLFVVVALRQCKIKNEIFGFFFFSFWSHNIPHAAEVKQCSNSNKTQGGRKEASSVRIRKLVNFFVTYFPHL